MTRRKKTPWHRIVEASEKGTGVSLRYEDVQDLAQDDAIMTRGNMDREIFRGDTTEADEIARDRRVVQMIGTRLLRLLKTRCFGTRLLRLRARIDIAITNRAMDWLHARGYQVTVALDEQLDRSGVFIRRDPPPFGDAFLKLRLLSAKTRMKYGLVMSADLARRIAMELSAGADEIERVR